ncbi:MAG: HAMP domain-containing sensor histidine kinase [Kofleriaceae bacterium]|nr:HAMP domain-containing sensor histidine kinase [Kofleriaceae bacterium]
MATVAVLQLALLMMTAVVIVIITRPLGEARPEDHLDPIALATVANSGVGLDAELSRLRSERIAVSIYNSERQLVATNVDPPLAVPRVPPRFLHDGPPIPNAGGAPPDLSLLPPGDNMPPLPGSPPDGPARERASFGPGLPVWWSYIERPFVFPFHIAGDRGLLVARGERAQPPGWTGPILILVGALLILVLGAIVTARWLVRPIDRLARTARALGGGDLSARSHLARTDEIGELGVRFDEMAERIESLMRAEKELFANVAHELRTPLARIGVALDLAGEGDAAAARASLAEIAVDVGELERIVDDILTTMRFEVSGNGPGSIPLRKQLTAPADIVEASVARHEGRHPERALEVRLASGLSTLEVDPMLVRRVLDNLLENAHKYTPDLGAPTQLSACERDGKIVFEVADRGCGIASEDLPRVFTAFFRADRSRSRETGGVGLGLTLAKRIVEAHGGTIGVTSELGAGTTVRMELPVA